MLGYLVLIALLASTIFINYCIGYFLMRARIGTIRFYTALYFFLFFSGLMVGHYFLKIGLPVVLYCLFSAIVIGRILGFDASRRR